MGEQVIVLTELTKQYGNFTAVDHIRLSIRKGEIFGLLGPNGAGKSTTILMMLGLTEPTSGVVEICGINSTTHPIEVKKKIGYLPEDVGFYDDMTGPENLMYTARLNGIPDKEAKVKALELMRRVGLEDQLKKKTGKYSRGMRQRLGLADKFAPLLVSAYPTKLPMLMGEMSSDNVMDNGAQFDDMLLQEQLYLWEDPTGNDDDSPYGLWEACYNAIASANQALEGMDALGNPDNVKAQRGEALICRAYSHFLLANIFCMPYNPQTADQHLGIPYCKTTEKEVFVNYERGTLAQTYEQIAADIEEGLPLISDASYSVLKYHFNKKAANAFAARFYLYYQKWDQVIECADRVIGNNPGTSLRHWEEDFGELSLVSDVVSQYTSEKKVANLLISTAFSESGYVTGPWDIYKRYGHGQEIYKHQSIDTYGPWSVRGGLMMANFIISVLQKNPFPKITTFFEYTDKANNIGYAHTVVVPFTTDETILCRAEAYVLSSQHNYEKALEDINNWIVYHSVISEDEGADLTLEALNSFYDALPYEPALVNTVADRSLKKKLNPEGFTVNAGTEENLIQLILQLRRLEGLQEGLRWYDLKRYGIEFSHNRAGNVPIVLTKDDPRRAIQLPPDVINAGMKANPRN